MATKTAPVEEKRKDLPTATLIKRAERKPGRPSEARMRRVQERLVRSPFVTDDH